MVHNPWQSFGLFYETAVIMFLQLKLFWVSVFFYLKQKAGHLLGPDRIKPIFIRVWTLDTSSLEAS
ncbi:hypothetical protein AM500_19685 [Bacillus sp. FJAT-18017]|nr:hypothetical protein AM500_19685 [Bacillus sp. FJAT-18017]